MKLSYNSQEDHEELAKLILDLIIPRKNEILSGLSCRHLFNRLYGIDIDQHEFAWVLDIMHKFKQAEYNDHNYGDTQYKIL